MKLCPLRGKIRKILINLEKSSFHDPLAGRLCYLAWNIPGARRLKIFAILMDPKRGQPLI